MPSAYIGASRHEASVAKIAALIRGVLQDGSAANAERVQRFFTEAIRSHGWRTADLRRAMRQCRREILREHDFRFLVRVADQLFSGQVLEEKIAGVFLLENKHAQFGDSEFRIFEAWLDRISNWSDHDALVHDLIAADRGRTSAGESGNSLGKVEKSLAPASGLRGADSRIARQPVLPRDCAAGESAA
jgi:hypothetical protein